MINIMEGSFYQKITAAISKENHDDFSLSLKNSLDDIISFSGLYQNCCVCIVDAVDSTKITACLPKTDVCKYYSIFLNAMALIAREFGATVVKNVGDSLLYYFPEISNTHSNSSFIDSLECGMFMIRVHNIINEKMVDEGLPHVDYRISADYGMVMQAKSVASANDDIFGSPVNICAKINNYALRNGMVIGGDLYQIAKSIKVYNFQPINDYSVGFKTKYSIYRVLNSRISDYK